MSQIISANAIEFVKNRSGEDEILGTGHFGLVKKAIWTRTPTSRLTVAVKCLHQDPAAPLNQQAMLDIVNEVSAMCTLNHTNLIKLYGIVFNADAGIMMVTELAAHGSLYAYLRKFKLDKKYPPLNQIYSFIYQIGRQTFVGVIVE